MSGTRTHRPLPVRMRPLVVILLAVCLAATDFSSAQQAEPASFPAGAWIAIGHGRVADAEALARAQPVGDPDAAAILGHLLIRKGSYDEATRLLEPIAAQHPG